MSAHAHAHDLAIALTLPHLHSPEERTAFLADHAALAAINTYGRDTVLAIGRRFAGFFRDPLFVEGVKIGLGQSVSKLGLGNDVAEKAKEIIDAIHGAATSLSGDSDGAPFADRPMPSWTRAMPSRGPEFVSVAHEESVAMMPDGALVLVMKHDLLSVGTVTPDVDAITMRVVKRPEARDFDGVLIASGLGRGRGARLLAVVPTKEGHKIPLDTMVPTLFSPGAYHGLNIESLMSLPDDVIGKKYALDESSGLNLSVIRVDETGQIQALITAIYRPVETEGAAATAPEPAAPQTEGAAAAAPEPAAPPVSGVRKRRTKVDGAAPKKPRTRRM